MEELLNDIFDYLVANYAWYLVVMMSLIIAVTNTILMFVKKPIKALTGKIKNEKLRKLVNKIFIVLAFGFSALSWWGLSAISAQYFPFDTINVLMTGAFSIVIYAFGDGIITKSQSKQLVETTAEIVEDGKVDENDKTAIAEFWDKVK